jgi:hypothetical protein
MRRPIFVVLAVLCALPTVAEPPSGPSAATASEGFREVVAEGRAAIDFQNGGVEAARRAAQAQALRAAVEKTLGIYVSARSLTQNYRLVRDQVTTRAEGFATLEEVVREQVLPQEVRVVVRARVSLRPLAGQLKALGLTRAWRIAVIAPAEASDARAILERTLSDAGFPIVESSRDAEIAVTVRPRRTTVQETALDTAIGALTMHSVRSEVTVRATRVPTGEVVATLTDTDTAAHVDAATAGTQATALAAERIAPRLSDALLLLPAATAQPVRLVVSGLTSPAQAVTLEEALGRIGGVQGVTRRSYVAGRVQFELSVLNEGQPSLARALERLSVPLRVVSETRSQIVAAARP